MNQLLLIVGAIAVLLVLPVIQKLVLSEVEGWLPHLSRRLVQIAAQRVPEPNRGRYIEEWLAELSSFDDRRITALLWSLDLVRGSRSLQRELTDGLQADTVASPGVKRGLDVIVGTCVLIAMTPIIAVIALALRLDSPGPLLSGQWCIGRNGEPFRMFRFRTTSDDTARAVRFGALSDADPWSRPMSDRCITRVGRILRRTSLDETPQIFNVLLGQMSLVGPRPMAPELMIPDESHRVLRLSPGMTGLAQLSELARVSSTDLVAINDAYARDWTLRRDIKILVLTPLVLLRHRRGS